MGHGRLLTRLQDIVVPAIKAGVATGLAYFLGSLLPLPLGDYSYYAALGAFTVVGLFVVQSATESLQVLGSVAIGVSVAVAVQAASWSSAWSVGLTVLVCILLSALPLLGRQRTWAPVAALFVLAAGGPQPEPMALAYVVQVPLGAGVGILVNILLLAPLGLHELDRATNHVLTILPEEMRREAGRLVAASEGEALLPSSTGPSPALAESRGRLRLAVEQARRARRGNLRTRLPPHPGARSLARAGAVSRCAAALEAVSVVVAESAAARGQSGARLRRQAAAVLEQAAETFEGALRPGQHHDSMDRSVREIDHLLEQVRSTPGDAGLDHVLFGALAVTIRECLMVLQQSDLLGGERPGG